MHTHTHARTHTKHTRTLVMMWTFSSKAQSYLKYVSLVTLTFQNTLLILSMRYSRVLSGAMYFTTTAVLFSEFSKMVICLLIIFYQQRSNFLSHLHEAIVVNWLDTLKMSVPAIVYMLQNNLQYVAVSNLEAAVFQVRLIVRLYKIFAESLLHSVHASVIQGFWSRWALPGSVQEV